MGGIKCRPSVHATRKERVKQFHEISRNRMDCITDVGGINCRPSVHATREEKESNSFTKFHGTGWIVSRMWWHKLPPSCTRDTRGERVKSFHKISRNRMDCITDVGGIHCRPPAHATREEKESNRFTKFHETGWIVSRMWVA